MKTVLLYYPPNRRSVPIETVCGAIKEEGHKMLVLTLSERGDIHEALEKNGIETFVTVVPRNPGWLYFLKQAKVLVSFCRRHKVDVVWSQLQGANLICILAQKFMKAKVVLFRHHAESAFYAEYGEQFKMVRNKNEVRVDKIINRFAEKIVILSKAVWYGMEKYEACNMQKVVICPFIYDFTMAGKPDSANVAKIRNDHPCQLLLIMVSRLIETKQHLPVFEIVHQLIREGKSIKMIVMDDGPLRPQLEAFIKEHRLEKDITLNGYRNNIVDYYAASDMLIHPSLTEASNNVIKEIGYLKKAVSVCEDVGDFSDYIRDGENGYLMKRGQLKSDIERTIRDAYDHPDQLTAMGEKLREDVLRLFGDSKHNRQRFLQLI
jgi:glycosyltransferase involved in cell wall biosynthesis